MLHPAWMEWLLDFDRRGRADVRGVAPGRYVVRAFPGDLTTVPAVFEVMPQRTSIELEWRRR